ncbi:MAG: LysR family transcriptional regulator [Microbacterium enclense]
MGATLKQLRVFVALAEEGGFVAAGDALGLSQSSVSHTLATLERQVGASLLHRAPCTVTDDGARLLPHARATLAAADAFEAATPSSAPVTGMVTLAITPTAGYRVVPDLLARWRAKVPGIRIRLLEGDDVEVATWLETGAADAAILINPDSTAEQIVVARDEFRAVTRTDHPLVSMAPVALADFLDDPLLVSTAGCEPQIMELVRQVEIAYEPAQRVRELTTLMAMVDAGLGITIMPTLVDPLLPASLTMTPLIHTLTRELVLTGPLTRPWHPRVRTLCGIIRTEENGP